MNYMSAVRVFAPMVLALSLCACKPATTEQAKKEGKTLAEVNGNVITTQDFQTEVDRLPPYLKPMVQSSEGKRELLESMIVREIVLEQAKKDGIDKDKEVADRMEDLRKRLIVETYLKKKVEKEAQISDAEMKKFYDENKEKFKAGDQVKASHILVKTEEEAKDVLAKLKGGAKFDELAKKVSTDSSAAKGGDLGWFPKGAMVPEFEKVAFSLKEGETSGIVKTQFGYHIIMVTGKRPAGIAPYEDVKEQIRANLLPTKQQEIFIKMKDELKKGAKITIKDDVLKDLAVKTTDDKGGATASKK